jgi:hypothetical protein
MANSHLGNASTVPAVPTVDHEEEDQLKDDTRPITVHLPQKLPKDRPFANIVEVKHTTAVPQHLQRIMDLKGAKPADKSARLKAALRRDNQVLSAYCVLLSGRFIPIHETVEVKHRTDQTGNFYRCRHGLAGLLAFDWR